MDARYVSSGPTAEEPRGCGGGSAPLATGNALPVLHEIQAALDRLIATGEATVIDLRAMPFLPGDEAFLTETLGRGEIVAEVAALGRSLVTETGIAGVWLIEHLDAADNPIAKFIEITRMPELLTTPREDLRNGARVLRDKLKRHG